MPARDANGRALPSRLRFYMPQTTTPAEVYADSGLTTPLEWPIVSDSAGRWPAIWADEQTYFDVTWSDLATDSLIKGESNIRPLSDSMSASADIAAEAAIQAQEAADAAAASAAEAVSTIAELGDFSQAVTDSQAAAVTATTKAAEAVASAAAAAASAASVDTDEILIRARASAIAFASLL
jgi:hypothetical protein